MKLPKPIRSFLWSLAGKRLLGWIKDAAEGKHGPVPAKIYASMAGAKTWTGFVTGCCAVVLASIGKMEAAAVVVSAALLMQGVGFVDAAWRSGPPAALRQWVLYRFLAAYSAELATGIAALSAAFASCGVETASYLAEFAGLRCEQAAIGLLGLSGLLAWMGLYDAAGSAQAPAVKLPPAWDEAPAAVFSAPVYVGQPHYYIVTRTDGNVHRAFRGNTMGEARANAEANNVFALVEVH